MQLNENTMKILQSFARINPNVLLEEGSVIRTIAFENNVFAKATIEDEFPQDIGIYDLNDFLSVMKLVEDPQLDFKEKYVTIKSGSGRGNVKYYYTDPDMIKTTTMEGKVPPTDVEISFNLDSTTMARVLKAASTLGHEDVSVSPSGKSLRLSVFDRDSKTANTYEIDVAGEFPDDEKFTLIFGVENLRKLMVDEYDVTIFPKKRISKFECKNPDLNLVYFVALEENSKYGE